MAKITSIQMKRMLDERLNDKDYRTSYNRDKDTWRIEWKDSKQGMSIAVPSIIAKYNERGEAALDENEENIREALRIMNKEYELKGMEKSIYPVIRSTSFPTETKKEVPLVTKEHTAETRVFYAL